MTQAKLNRHGDIETAEQATANTYTAHYFVDGDEVLDSVQLKAGPDYAIGDSLKTLAKRQAEKAIDHWDGPRIEQIECLILCDCCGYDLAAAEAYPWGS